jgi:peroxiredoxin family protein
MGTITEPTEADQTIEALSARVAALERAMPEDRLTLGLISGDLDKTMAAFIIALGARAFDTEVDMFATFWATAVFRDPGKKVKKGAVDSMFGVMLPTGAGHLPLSKMQMVGMGPWMIRKAMAAHGAKSLEELIAEAGKQGVRLHICSMTMDVMGMKPQEMIDYPNLDIVGVGQFIDMVSRSRHCWFL